MHDVLVCAHAHGCVGGCERYACLDAVSIQAGEHVCLCMWCVYVQYSGVTLIYGRHGKYVSTSKRTLKKSEQILLEFQSNFAQTSLELCSNFAQILIQLHSKVGLTLFKVHLPSF